ncbi:MAG: hypothetical protein PHP43_08465 [Methanoculleus sp.]|nr:hypothetical protein [Methanoculleus sp.]
MRQRESLRYDRTLFCDRKSSSPPDLDPGLPILAPAYRRVRSGREGDSADGE